MGSGVSTDYPEVLSEQQIKEICGDKFNPVLYRSVKDSNGNVKRDDFIKVMSDGVEVEIIDLFNLLTSHTHHEMDSRTFVKLCKELKLLNKNNFNVKQCDLLYTKTKSHISGSNKTLLPYYEFRNSLLPALAEAKNIEVSQLLLKMSSLDLSYHNEMDNHHSNVVRLHDDKSTYTGSAKASNDTTNDMFDEEAHNKTKAAIKIQRISRQKSARMKVNALKEVKMISTTTVNPDKDFSKYDEGSSSEIKAMSVFVKFTPKGEIDSKNFIKLLKDTAIINNMFLSSDGDLIFKKTIAKAMAPGADSYKDNIIHGKRFGYSIFRIISVPLIAEKKGCDIETILGLISNCSGPTLNNVTVAKDTTFHDGSSTSNQ